MNTMLRKVGQRFVAFMPVFLLFFVVVGCQSTTTKTNSGVNGEDAAKINTELAVYYLKQNQYARAKQKLLTALTFDERYSFAYSVFAYYDEKTEDNEGAEKNYRKALQLSPGDGSIHNNYGRFLCIRKRYVDAMKQFDLAIQDKNYLDVETAYKNAGFCALQVGDKKLAEKYFKKL